MMTNKAEGTLKGRGITGCLDACSAQPLSPRGESKGEGGSVTGELGNELSIRLREALSSVLNILFK